MRLKLDNYFISKYHLNNLNRSKKSIRLFVTKLVTFKLKTFLNVEFIIQNEPLCVCVVLYIV